LAVGSFPHSAPLFCGFRPSLKLNLLDVFPQRPPRFSLTNVQGPPRAFFGFFFPPATRLFWLLEASSRAAAQLACWLATVFFFLSMLLAGGFSRVFPRRGLPVARLSFGSLLVCVFCGTPNIVFQTESLVRKSPFYACQGPQLVRSFPVFVFTASFQFFPFPSLHLF